MSNYVYPGFHGEIDLVSDAVDGFYNILDDNVDIVSNEEKTARNNYIVVEIALENSHSHKKMKR